MKDWLLAGLVYVPAWVIGRMLCRYVPVFDPFVVGWMVSGTAVLLRVSVPWLRASGVNRNARSGND